MPNTFSWAKEIATKGVSAVTAGIVVLDGDTGLVSTTQISVPEAISFKFWAGSELCQRDSSQP